MLSLYSQLVVVVVVVFVVVFCCCFVCLVYEYNFIAVYSSADR